MLKSLAIFNIVLIESQRIDFSPGLTVLTGETGSGKSAILKALALTLGARADASLIRKGASKGRVEASFDIEALPNVATLLEEAGLEHQAQSELIICREVTTKGKGRSFVNQQMVQTTFLKTLSGCLLDLVGQSANVRLTNTSYHLETIDLYGNLKPDVAAYQKSFQAVRELQTRIDALTQNEAERIRKQDRIQHELDEIRQVNPQEGEDNELFQEIAQLTHSEELASLVQSAIHALEGEAGAMPKLYSCQRQIDAMAKLDPNLIPSEKTVEGILVETQELAYTLKEYQGKLEHNPQRLEVVSARLSQIEYLKKKYGPDVAAYQKELEEEFGEVSGGEEQVENLQSALIKEQTACKELGAALTTKRKKIAKRFEESVTAHLRPLNLKEAQFEVRLQETDLTSTGGDTVEFYFSPNIGEGSISVCKCASGGELSRLLLALKTALSGLERTPTLIFDEIDTGMGGETAVLVGQKLKTIATGRQVLCITHLPQVARQADHHFAIEKREEEGRTLTRIDAVTGDAKRIEVQRMQGGALLAKS